MKDSAAMIMPTPLTGAIVLSLSVPLYICFAAVQRLAILKKARGAGPIAAILILPIILLQSHLATPAVCHCHQVSLLSLFLLLEMFGLIPWLLYCRAKLLGVKWWESDKGSWALVGHTLKRRVPVMISVGVLIGLLQNYVIGIGIRVPPFLYFAAFWASADSSTGQC
jgi:hypothetical protein